MTAYSKDLAGRIRQRLEQLGLSANGASASAGLDRTSLKSILDGRSKNPRADTLMKLSHVLECSFEWLVSGLGEGPPPQPVLTGRTAAGKQAANGPPAIPEGFPIPGAMPLPNANMAKPNPSPAPPRQDMPLNVPVYGTAAGSLGQGAFAMEMAPVDYVRRPPGITNAVDVYAVYIEGDSMEPRFYPGELVYVNPRRPAAPGDFVVVQLQTGEHEVIQAYCKKLLRKSTNTLFLQQFNPDTVLELPMAKIRAIHRILPLNELMGI